MALLQADHLTVYVAFHFVLITLLSFTSATPGRGSANVLSLPQPYDFLYYTGVRSYFGEEWVKAAELLEKAILTKESLSRVRRQCHEECVEAGREAFNRLGKVQFICSNNSRFKVIVKCVTAAKFFVAIDIFCCLIYTIVHIN